MRKIALLAVFALVALVVPAQAAPAPKPTKPPKPHHSKPNKAAKPNKCVPHKAGYNARGDFRQRRVDTGRRWPLQRHARGRRDEGEPSRRDRQSDVHPRPCQGQVPPRRRSDGAGAGQQGEAARQDHPAAEALPDRRLYAYDHRQEGRHQAGQALAPAPSLSVGFSPKRGAHDHARFHGSLAQ